MPSLTRLTTGGVLNPLKNTTKIGHNKLLHQESLQPPLEPREDVAADDPARSTYIQCAGSTGVMTVEIRVTGQDGSYKHYVVAREPVADPESWMGIEWDPGEGGPAAVRVHPEEVFTGEQAAPVFRAYVVDGRLPAPELLRPLDI